MFPRSAIVFLLGLGPMVGLALGGCDRQDATPAQANATAAAPAAPAAPAMPGAVPAGPSVDRSHAGEPAPTETFQTPAGKPTTLAAFRGKPMLVNLWATWCAPCVAELPTLDQAARDAGAAIAVVPISQDLDAGVVAPFLAARGVKALTAYRDPALALSVAYGANLPTTIFYDAAGREKWRLTGGIDWTGATARALLAER